MYKILIVDDDKNNVLLFKLFLEEQEYKTIECYNGKDAIRLAIEELPHLIILDIMLPLVSGLDVCKELSNNEKTKNIPIILVTAKVEEKDLLSGFEAGAYDYIKKPVSAMEFISRVKAALKLKYYIDNLENIVNERTKELQLKNTELIKEKIRVEEANKLKDQFLSNISHELRTPLNSIINFIKMVIEGVYDKDTDGTITILNSIQKKKLENSLNSSKSLLKLIDDLLDLTRIHSGKMEIDISSFSLKNLFDNNVPLALDLYLKTKSGEKKQVEVTYNIKDFVVSSDYTKVYQIIINIISNAAKFTEKGYINIIADEMDNNFFISVEDSGIGMKDEDLDIIFEEFRQIDGSAGKKYEGSGLGLAITKNYVDILGGKIKVESKQEKGSKFTIILPNIKKNI